MRTLYTIQLDDITATFERELIGDEIAFVHIEQAGHVIDYQDLPETTQIRLHDAAIKAL